MIDIYSRISMLCVKYFEDNKQAEEFMRDVSLILNDYSISAKSTALAIIDNTDLEVIKMFLGVKSIEGKSKKTLSQYANSLKMLKTILNNKNLLKVGTNEIRYALAVGMQSRKWGAVVADNYRRYWSSFYNFAEAENYIEKSPIRAVKQVKGEKRERKPLTDADIEKLRINCKSLRNRALLEFFLSTGCRVSEGASLQLKNLDLINKTALVMGKGKKERTVYITDQARVYIERYLKSRKDDVPFLFVSEKAPYEKLGASGIEVMFKQLGEKSGVERPHPHRFRHTMATKALLRGMPVEQVKEMLGHEKLDTTMIYAKVNQNQLRNSHEKFLG